MRSTCKTKSNWIYRLTRNTTQLIYHCFVFKFFFCCRYVSNWSSNIGHRIFLIICACLLIILLLIVGALIVLIKLVVKIVHLNRNSRLCLRVHFLAVVENRGVVVSYRIGLLSGVELFESLGISVLTWLGLDAVREWTMLVRITYRLILKLLVLMLTL